MVPIASVLKNYLIFEVIYDCPCCTGSTVRGCSSYETFFHNGCGPVCEGIAITDMRIERTTFSYTDETMATLASAIGGAITDKALTCDDVAWTF